MCWGSAGDRPFLISGADDRTAKVWDYQTKACVQVHTTVLYCTFSCTAQPPCTMRFLSTAVTASAISLVLSPSGLLGRNVRRPHSVPGIGHVDNGGPFVKPPIIFSCAAMDCFISECCWNIGMLCHMVCHMVCCAVGR